MSSLTQYSQNANLQKIRDILLDSDIAPDEQDNLLNLFSKARDADLKPVIKLFAEDSSWIKKINENFKAKQKAFAENDNIIWKEILKNEERQLKESGS